MLRGIQKRMIQVRFSNNRYFETAYFVLRSDLRERTPRENDMTREANRILSESDLVGKQSNPRGARGRGRIFPFFCGLLSGASAVALVWLCVMLFL